MKTVKRRGERREKQRMKRRKQTMKRKKKKHMSKRMRRGSNMRRNMVDGNLNGGNLLNNIIKFGVVNANGNENRTTFTWDKGRFRRVSKDEQVAEVRNAFKFLKDKLKNG